MADEQKVLVLGDELPCDNCHNPATVMIRHGEYAIVFCDPCWLVMRNAYIPLTSGVRKSINDALGEKENE